MTQLAPVSRSEVTRLPLGHARLDATRLSLQQLAPLLGCLHEGCPHGQVAFFTPASPQAFSVASAVPSNGVPACSLVQGGNRGG